MMGPDVEKTNFDKLFDSMPLTADQLEIAKLREELARTRNALRIMTMTATQRRLRAKRAEQRAELAEAKIREAEGPVAEYNGKVSVEVYSGPDLSYDTVIAYTDIPEGTKLYRHHIQPADIAELQAKYDRLDQIASDAVELNNTQAQRIAELEIQLSAAPAVHQHYKGIIAEMEREIRELKRDVSTIAKQRDDLDAENLRLVECNAQMERKLAEQQETTIPDNSQDWAGMDGAIAWHLIDRHAENWADIGKMMHEWLGANSAKARAEAVPEGMKHVCNLWVNPETREIVVDHCDHPPEQTTPAYIKSWARIAAAPNPGEE